MKTQAIALRSFLNPGFGLLFGLLLCVWAQVVSAAPLVPSRSRGDLPYLTANKPAYRVDLNVQVREQRLGFIASAGESVALNVGGSTFGDACSASLTVVDETDQPVSQPACAAGGGQVATLTATKSGTYFAKISARADATGSLQVSLLSTARRTQPKRLDCVIGNLALDAPINDAWNTSCGSVSFSGHYAQYYTFTVPVTEVITISLGSATNAYLVLHNGASPTGTVVTSDDNSGPGLDARIVRTLTAGTYTIEATTWASGQLGSFTLAARTNSAPCFSKLSLNKSASSKWLTSCSSISFDDHYSRYYTLSVPTDEVVTITLSSATNAYLVLRSGSTQLGMVVATDDNSGAGLDAQIVRTLSAGTYTIEATTWAAGQLGNFTLVARTDEKPCFRKLSLDVTASSQWTTDCESVSFGDHYAKYYTLTLKKPAVVTISLSSATNAYLVLHSGPTQLGTVVSSDDNSGPGLDARILMSLAAGTYTVEATTWASGQLGDFDLTARTNTAPCFQSIALDTPLQDQWTGECSSNSFDDHFAKYYTLTVPTDEAVTISLNSATNGYLVLRSGSTQLGTVVASDDNSGPGLDARIVRTLTAGTYTIEATTWAAGQQGIFTLTARSNTLPCFQTLALDNVVQNSWINECSSISFDDHYARYYTLTVPVDQMVTINLSSATNAYLVLRSGPTQFGTVIASDDNSGAGLDARIIRTLTAGTYTIEATTWAAGQQGTYAIVARTNSAPCFAPVAMDTATPDNWVGDCTSVSFDDHFSKYYTMTVPVTQPVSILLASATNSYLVLRSGPNQLGTVIAQDDNSGGGLNAKIAATLTAGTYTIEATTWAAGQMGSFLLTLGN